MILQEGFQQLHPLIVRRAGHEFGRLDRVLQLRIVRIEPEERRLPVAMAVIGQVDVDQALGREPGRLRGGVFANLLAEDDARQAPIFASRFAVSAEHEPFEEELVGLDQGFQFGGRDFQLFGGLIPGRAIGAKRGRSFEQGFFLRRGRRGIGGPADGAEAGFGDGLGDDIGTGARHGATSLGRSRRVA